MKTKTGLLIQEGGPNEPTYISPEINGSNFKNVWAMWIFPDGEAQIYLKRDEDGAVLGKPIKIPAPPHEHRFENENSKKFRPCLDCGREYRTLYSPEKSGLTD